MFKNYMRMYSYNIYQINIIYTNIEVDVFNSGICQPRTAAQIWMVDVTKSH